MKKITLLLVLISALFADFSASNVQLLYSDSFNGNSFVYDAKDGKKATLTLEHFREFKYGDLFWFADVTNASYFDGQKTKIYSEISPRVSLSKISNQKISFGAVKDVYASAQYNVGKGYEAWLVGGGVDLQIPFMRVFGVNVYDKRQNVEGKRQTQTTINYKTNDFYGLHMTGFHDITDEDYSTQNQLLYALEKQFGIKGLYIGLEHLRYRHKKGQHTDAMQAMLKMSW